MCVHRKQLLLAYSISYPVYQNNIYAIICVTQIFNTVAAFTFHHFLFIIYVSKLVNPHKQRLIPLFIFRESMKKATELQIR